MRSFVSSILACAVLLAAAAGAGAAARTSLSDLEDEVMCPTCGTALSLSESPLADRMRAFIQRQIDAGSSKEAIKDRLVDEFGPEVLASPPRRGFTLAAYLVPAASFALVALAIAITRARRRGRPPPPAAGPAGEGFDELVDADLAGSGR